MEWLAKQLIRGTPGSLNLEIPRYNPRPAGVIRPGSTTDSVLVIFVDSPGRWFSFKDFKARIRTTDKALNWALIYLQRMGHIESSTGDDPRNSRYMRYRLISK